MAYYRNRTTGKVQQHPKSGLGDALNSDEIEETGKPIKPFVKLPITKDKIGQAKKLMGDKPDAQPKAAASKTSAPTESKGGDPDTGPSGDEKSKQEGAD